MLVASPVTTSGRVPNAVNVATHTGADSVLVVRHLDRVGVLASVLGVLREEGVNVEEMENTIFEGGEGAVARMHVHGDVKEPVLHSIREQEHVLSASARSLSARR